MACPLELHNFYTNVCVQLFANKEFDPVPLLCQTESKIFLCETFRIAMLYDSLLRYCMMSVPEVCCNEVTTV